MKTSFYIPLFLVTIFLSSSFTCSAQQYPADIENKIQQVEQNLGGSTKKDHPEQWDIASRMKFYKVNGLSIAVVHNYKIEWAKAYGLADVEENRPVTTQTLFQAASISKSINALGVLKLVSEKKLDLYADINNYLTTWKFPYDSVSKGKKINTANLLSHTAGLTVHGFPGYTPGNTLPTIPEILDGKKPANTPAVRSQFEPGLRSVYSGGGTVISQQLIMDITHQQYDQFMYKNVLKPLGMKSSFYTQPAPADKAEQLATAYYVNGMQVVKKFHVYPEEAPAGLWTNPTDLAKYIIETQLALQGKSKVLDEQMTKLRLTPYMDKAAALGVFIMQKGDAKYFSHGGANEGFRSIYYGSMDGGDGIAVMVNSDNGDIMNEIVNSVARVYNWKGFIKKIFPLSAEQLKNFEGKYQFERDKNTFLQISAAGDHLVLKQLWDGRTIDFLPESETRFSNENGDFPLEFKKDNSGKAIQVTAFDRDIWNKVNN